MQYAQNTSVSMSRSLEEIERELMRYGAMAFFSGTERTESGGKIAIGFKVKERAVKIVIELPDPNNDAFTRTPTGRERRNQDAVGEQYQQACRQKYRALLLVIKAKLEAIESGISTFDNEFLAFMVLSNGKTVGETMKPQLDLMFKEGKLPKLLTMAGD